jgi:hypothetical protein
MAASTLTRICGVQATTLAELLDHLRRISPDSVFHHTFQSLSTHHFLTEGFSNDFAQWALTASNAPELAERLAALDIRVYESVESLRADLVRLLEEFVRAQPPRAYQKAFEPFYFCESRTVTLPSEWSATDLASFCEGLQHISHESLYFHFVAARLREPLTVNDFSHWLEDSLGLKELADRVDLIDIYTNTLDRVRELIREECARWLEA